MTCSQSDTTLLWLLSPMSQLQGVGPALASLLQKATGGKRIIDLLFHLPETYTDRRYKPKLSDALAGRIITIEAQALRITRPMRSRQPWKITISDGTAEADVALFSPYQAKKVKVGASLVVSGRLEIFGKRLNIASPDYVEAAEHAARIPAIDPIWPLTAGLFAGHIRRILRHVFEKSLIIEEWLDAELLAQTQWPGFITALHQIHFPADFPELLDDNLRHAALERARQRLAYDELLANQIAIGLTRRHQQARRGRALMGTGLLQREALNRFGHPLTPDQIKACKEIGEDLRSPFRMLRLLQGDVGSGKTLVALMAMLHTAEAGAQAAIMAPTEILARQHHATLCRLSPVPVAFLSSSVKGKARQLTLSQIAKGIAPLVVGTHALFQEGVTFHDLALAIIDEQHRFGVNQRLMLGEKGENTNLLSMTATPIPRTLLLTQWGEMQVSRLLQKPSGRKPVRTTVHGLSSIPKVIAGLQRMMEKGAQIFWVCPLIMESEATDLAAAEARFNELCKMFPDDTIGLAHGQQDISIREKAIADFAGGKTRILVATTVIEVGVDIPSATVMVIEHAERFGLAQLHQLRGRVGRGHKEAFCLLLHEDSISPLSYRRLSLLRDTEDGFRIADEDFRIRGGGDVTGHRQSGMLDFKLASAVQQDLFIQQAQDNAERALTDPPLPVNDPKAPLSRLLSIFSKDNALRVIQSG